MDPKILSSSKINPTKLLGGSSFANNTNNISEKLKEDSITISKSDLSIIKGQVFEIKNLVTNLTTLKKKRLKTERKETEREKFDKKEKELEKKKKPEDNKIKLPQAPKLGFLDIIRRFVVNTLIGFIAIRLIKHLPKMIEVVKFLGGAMDFITNVGGNLLNGLATFVQKGYEAYDFTRKTLKTFGGDNAVKLFDGFNNALGGIVTAALAASFALFDMAGGDSSGSDNVGIKGRTPGRSRRGIDPKLARRYTERFGRDAAARKFGQEGVRSLGGKYARSGAENLARRGVVSLAGKGGTKALLGVVRPLLKRLPIIGALIDFGLSVALGEDPGRAAFKAIGAGLLGSIGAAVGSLAFGFGGIIGGILGSIGGDAIGGALYDLFFGNKKPEKQKVAKAAGGGQAPVTRGGKIVSGPRRSITKSKVKRQIAIQPTQLKPGADVGGEKKIEKVFPKSKDKNQVSPLDYIEKSYKNTNQDKSFGSLLNLQTKSLVGQKPSKIDYKNAAQGLSNWMTMTFSDEILRTGAVYAAGGGEINADMLSKKSGDMTDAIARSLEDSISKRLDANIDDLMKQMMLKEPEIKGKPGQQPKGGGEEGGEGGAITSVSGQAGNMNKGAEMLVSAGVPIIGAAYLAGNIQQESSWNGQRDWGQVMGDGTSRNGGLVSWASWSNDPARLGRIEKHLGKNIKEASDGEQINAMLWEMKTFYPNAYKVFMDSNATDSQLRKASYQYWGYGHEGPRFNYAQKALQHLQTVKDSGNKPQRGGIRPSTSSIGVRGSTSSAGVGGSTSSAGKVFHPETGGGYSGGQKDQSGRPVVLSKHGAERFRRMVQDSGLNLGASVASSGRSESKNRAVGGDPNSHHMYGEAMDMNGPGYEWVKKHGKKYGWQYGYHHGPESAHFKYVGPGAGVPPKLAQSQKELQGYAFHGGFIDKEGEYKLHEGEFVVDKDSVDLVGRNFIATINAIENKTQLQQKVGSLIGHLSYITDYENLNQEPQIVYIEVPVEVPMMMPVPIGGEGCGGGGSGYDSDRDELYAHG
jgi:hypothetical protein